MFSLVLLDAARTGTKKGATRDAREHNPDRTKVVLPGGKIRSSSKQRKVGTTADHDDRRWCRILQKLDTVSLLPP